MYIYALKNNDANKLNAVHSVLGETPLVSDIKRCYCFFSLLCT